MWYLSNHCLMTELVEYDLPSNQFILSADNPFARMHFHPKQPHQATHSYAEGTVLLRPGMQNCSFCTSKEVLATCYPWGIRSYFNRLPRT